MHHNHMEWHAPIRTANRIFCVLLYAFSLMASPSIDHKIEKIVQDRKQVIIAFLPSKAPRK